MSLDAVLTQIAAVQATIPNVTRAYDTAPASLKEYPAFVNYAERGEIERVPNMQIAKHRVKMMLFVTKAHQETAEALLRPFVDSTLQIFNRNITLNSSCANCMVTGYEYGKARYDIGDGSEEFLTIGFDLLVVEWLTQNYAAAPAWLVADSVSDPDAGWTDDALASDGDLSTGAAKSFSGPAWSKYLYFNIASLECSSVRYYFQLITLSNTTGQVQVDVYVDGAWISVYDGLVTGLSLAWQTKTFAGGLVTQARMRFYNAEVTARSVKILEFQFYG